MIYIRIIVFNLLVFCSAAQAMAPCPVPPTINQLSIKLNQELLKIDNSVAMAAHKLGPTSLNDDDTAAILLDLYYNCPSAVVASTIDSNGVLLCVVPQKYYYSRGEKISSQAHFSLIKKTQKPVLSNIFKTVEGFYAVSLMHPVFNRHNSVEGFVSLVFQPQAFFKNTVQPYLNAFPSIEALAIQQDGRIIYDKDITQVGQMTFSDPMYQNYPSLLEIARRITMEASGSGTYTFIDNLSRSMVSRDTQWDTISLYNTQWRLILSQ